MFSVKHLYLISVFIAIFSPKTHATKYINIDGFEVSDNCKIKCQALSAAKKKDRVNKLKKDQISITLNKVGHPAAQICFQLGGTNIIEKKEYGNERDVCLFKDQSRIASWSLYDAHFNRK